MEWMLGVREREDVSLTPSSFLLANMGEEEPPLELGSPAGGAGVEGKMLSSIWVSWA